jgi:multimeric flavodoxin WrbA
VGLARAAQGGTHLRKVLAISGSSRAKGNTTVLLDEALKSIRGRCEVELVALADFGPPGSRNPEAFATITSKMRAADAILLGTPSHFGMPAARLKALLDATWDDAKKGAFEGKVGAAFSVEAEGGGELACMGLAHFFSVQRMAFVGYVVGRASREGDILLDLKATRDARALCSRVADYLDSRRA